jgi:hypothetical protein
MNARETHNALKYIDYFCLSGNAAEIDHRSRGDTQNASAILPDRCRNGTANWLDAG